MLYLEKGATDIGTLAVAFDLEWTKDYRRKNGSVPFCFSFVAVNLRTRCPRPSSLAFGFIGQYVERGAESEKLICDADRLLTTFLERDCTIVGHQLPSDISTAIRYVGQKRANGFSRLKQLWHSRGQPHGGAQVFDTRYDLEALLEGRSRRLVDVCGEFRLDVRQPEIRGSMTRMQRLYYETADRRISDGLRVLNLRHALSSLLLFMYATRSEKPDEAVNVNRILHSHLERDIVYLASPQFEELLESQCT